MMQAHTVEYIEHLSTTDQDKLTMGAIIYDWLRLYTNHIDDFGCYFDLLYGVQAINGSMTLQEFMITDHMKVLNYLERANNLSKSQRREAVAMYVSFLYYISRITKHRFNPFR